MRHRDESNPFAPIRAADFTDEQINSLWVDLGGNWIANVLEPRSITSKYILGSKGSGKTHLLRYHSYQVARLRSPNESGLTIVQETGCLAVFLRTTNIDAGRFELSQASELAVQQLFSVHLELKLAELVIDALEDIKGTSPAVTFNDAEVIKYLSNAIGDVAFNEVSSLMRLREWISDWIKSIDAAVNASAFTGRFDLQLPFSFGALALPLGAAVRRWNSALSTMNLVYILDEIENLSEMQQEVINTLVRYAEGRVSFRMTGRLYSRKTLGTISGGEENREGSEFAVTRLDELLRNVDRYTGFATKFIAKRLGYFAFDSGKGRVGGGFDPSAAFEELDAEKLIEEHALPARESRFVKQLGGSLGHLDVEPNVQEGVISLLVDGFPSLVQRLNVLRYCKGFSKGSDLIARALRINEEGTQFVASESRAKGAYATAMGHWKWDLLAQLCRESNRRNAVVPYAGFKSLVAISAHNPRNLLVLLGKIYEIASFRGIDLSRGNRVTVDIQTQGAIESARFCFEGDTNYGVRSDGAREAVARLAELLRVARYSLNIPEVSPLAVSFDNEDLSVQSRNTLESAFNYSLLFEIPAGRPDRNSQRLNRKVQLNPMLSARWGLPIGRRGDLSISGQMLNAIFEPDDRESFQYLVRQQGAKWNDPFFVHKDDFEQAKLF